VLNDQSKELACTAAFKETFYVNYAVLPVTGIVAMLVCVFCLCLLANQLRLIMRDLSFIDLIQSRQRDQTTELDLQKRANKGVLEHYQHKTRFARLAEVFGDRNILWWFLPVNRLSKKGLTVEHELNLLGL